MIPRVSVIVAVYNAGKTISRCIDSLRGQSLHDIEIILIDDGSTDSSASICDSYAEKDSRIKVWHKENEGVSKTRQKGIDNATGEYIVFLDSDDYVDLTMYEKLYRKAEEDNADIVCCDILRLENKGTRIYDHHIISSFEHDSFLEGLLDMLFGSMCNRIIRRSLFEEFQVRFNPEISYGEDKLALVELFSKAYNAGKRFKISYVPETLLYYDTTANPASLMKLDKSVLLKTQTRLWQEMGKTLDMSRFGSAYYHLLVKRGFKHLWNRTVNKEQFQELYSPFHDGIRKYERPSSRKYLVLLASSGKWELAQKIRWIAGGKLLSDKIRFLFGEK